VSWSARSPCGKDMARVYAGSATMNCPKWSGSNAASRHWPLQDLNLHGCTQFPGGALTSSARSIFGQAGLLLSSTSARSIHRRSHDSLICKSRAIWATGFFCNRANSTARRRNSGDFAAGITRIPPETINCLRLGIRKIKAHSERKLMSPVPTRFRETRLYWRERRGPDGTHGRKGSPPI
jgi:hypothetical protein